MRLSGKIAGANIDFKSGKPLLTLEVNERHDFELLVDEMKDNERLSIEVKPFKKRRSLDANAYFWVLCDKLAEKLGRSKVDIYREYVKDIGGNNEVVCVKNNALDRLCQGWQRNGMGWLTDTFPSKIDGCTNVILYMGSSEYTADQMHRLLELCIADCKDQGIPTETPEEIALMVARWGE